jgi:outer membrane protein assembly factor BamB
LLWTFQTGNMTESSPAVANGVVYVGADDSNLYALDGKTGAKLWSARLEHYVDSPAVANGVVYVASSFNVYAVNARTGAKLWVYKVGYNVYGAAVANGMVYIGQAAGISFAFGLK